MRVSLLNMDKTTLCWRKEEGMEEDGEGERGVAEGGFRPSAHVLYGCILVILFS